MSAQAPVCDFGWPAPAFTLPDTEGRLHVMADLLRPHGLLVMFICNHCPYVQAILPRLVEDAHALMDLGVGVAAISSNDAAAYPEDGLEAMAALARQHAFRFPYLHDESQAVASLYGAVCTPDFFGFNAAAVLQYRGRFDASRKEAAPPGTQRELFEAMKLIAETGQGPREQVPSIGCSIKWKAG